MMLLLVFRCLYCFLLLFSFPFHLNTRKPNWSDDEKVCARCVTNEVHCFHDANFGKKITEIFKDRKLSDETHTNIEMLSVL